MRLAIPRFGEKVAPCFEYSATVAVFKIQNSQIVEQTDFRLQSTESFDRLRLLKDQGVEVLICGGIQDRFEDLVKASCIQVISWVSGDVGFLVDEFIEGRLMPDT